ncbi:hypothetical protein FQR65_LT10940 [Abscondita terminalis]|nr:hypothetical protein FQR65_LT10940 [Abscondita terminalis]
MGPRLLKFLWYAIGVNVKTSIKNGPFTKLHTFYFILLTGLFIFIYIQYTAYTNNQQTVIITREEQHRTTQKPNTTSVVVPRDEQQQKTTLNKTITNTKPEDLSIELIIVVQVHNREMYLRHLIDSLRGAAGIETVLLIFSHDYVDENLNKLIATIDFCKYKQIYFPYSIQKFPNTFPGPESDTHGSKRQPSLTQIKHHWWWKANAVFNSLSGKNYNGLVLLLEEDYYMVEDFIPALKQMEAAANEFCQTCRLFSLAVNLDAVKIDTGRVENANFVKITHKFSNMGLALSATTWKHIVECTDSFCNYNDNNWDFSLQNVLNDCLRNVDNMILMFPRVFHIGNCGVHVTSNNCDPTEALSKVGGKLKEANGKLYPKKLKERNRARFGGMFSNPNGGWEDVRDQKLCKNISSYVIDDF